MKNRHFPTVFLLLTMVLLSTLFALQGILLSSIIDAFNLTASNQGTPNTAAFAGGIVALAVTFVFSHKISKWAALNISLILCAITLVGLNLTNGWLSFITIWCILGFGMGMMDTLLSACMAQLYTGEQQVRMMCFLHTAFGLASALTPLLFNALMKRGLPWKSVYLFPAVFALLLFALAILMRLNRLDYTKKSPYASASLSIVHKAGLWYYMAAAFIHGIFLSGLNTWINRYAELSQKTGVSIVIPPMSFMFVGLMCSRVIMPFLPLRTEHYVRFAGIGAGAVTLIGILFPACLNPCILLSGVLFGALLPCLLSLGCKRVPSQTLTGTTALMLAFYLGESVASPAIGALEAAFNLRVGMLLCCACMVLTSLVCVIGQQAASTTKG